MKKNYFAKENYTIQKEEDPDPWYVRNKTIHLSRASSLDMLVYQR